VEGLAQGPRLALSEFRPQLSAQLSASAINRDDPAFRRTGSSDYEEWRLSASASQLIYGSGRVSNLVKQAQAELRGGQAQYQGAAQTILAQTAIAYADVLNGRARLEAQEALLANLLAQKEWVLRNQKAGFVTLTDTAQTDVRIEAARAQVARARSQLVSAELQFTRLVGRMPGALDSVATSKAAPLTLDAALETGLSLNPALRAAQETERAAAHSVGVARSAAGPRVSLEATSGIDNHNNLTPTSRIIEDVVSLRVSVPLFQGGAINARTSQQAAALRSARFDVAAIQRDTQQGVATAWAALQSARDSAVFAGTQLEAAELAVRGIKREQANGLRTVIDVLNQEQDLVGARLAVAQATRDVTVAEHQLLFEMGALACESCGTIATPGAEPQSEGRKLWGIPVDWPIRKAPVVVGPPSSSVTPADASPSSPQNPAGGTSDAPPPAEPAKIEPKKSKAPKEPWRPRWLPNIRF
jgi:outer membrane protein